MKKIRKSEMSMKNGGMAGVVVLLTVAYRLAPLFPSHGPRYTVEIKAVDVRNVVG